MSRGDFLGAEVQPLGDPHRLRAGILEAEPCQNLVGERIADLIEGNLALQRRGTLRLARSRTALRERLRRGLKEQRPNR